MSLQLHLRNNLPNETHGLNTPVRSMLTCSRDNQISDHHQELVGILLGVLVVHKVAGELLLHHYAVVLGGDAKEKQLDQREVDYKAVHADLDVVEEEVEDRAFKVPEKDAAGYELDLEVLEWHVAVMH